MAVSIFEDKAKKLLTFHGCADIMELNSKIIEVTERGEELCIFIDI